MQVITLRIGEVDAAMTLGFGALEVTVFDSSGRPVVGVTCELVPDVPGAGGDELGRESEGTGTCSWDRTHATTYRLDIWRRFRQDLVGSQRVSVLVEKTRSASVSIAAQP